MKKNKFVKSTFILLIGGFLTKVLGMIIKMIETRYIGTEGIGLFMLISPTFSLALAIAQMGFPVAISTLVARNYDGKKLILSLLPLALFTNLFLFLLFFLGKDFLASILLHDERLSLALFSIGFVLPFMSVSNLLRGYYFGKEKMGIHVFTNFVEDFLRILCLYFGIPYFLNYGMKITLAFLMLTNVISETSSILLFLLFLPKNFHLQKEDFKIEKRYQREALSISIPITISRIIGNIGYFLEPILLTNILLKVGYSNSFIVEEYGILNGYVMPILLLPSFFTMAISQALIPEMSACFGKKDFKKAKRKLKEAILFSLLVGIPCTLFFFFSPSVLLKLIYHTTKGISYLRFLSPFFLIFYIQAPLTSALQATGKSKLAMKGSLGGVILRTVLLTVGSYFKIGLWGLIIGMLASVFYVTFHQLYHIQKLLKE